MNDDQTRQAATGRDQSPDDFYSLSVEEVMDMYEEAGLPRTSRTIQRYCALGKLDCHKLETLTGEQYMVKPHSVERHIKYIKEVYRPDATSRDMTRHDATSRALENKNKIEERHIATSIEQPRQAATVPGDKYVVGLERENEFLRGQVDVKDMQIAALIERAREDNVLTAGLHKLLTPLLNPDNRSGGEASLT